MGEIRDLRQKNVNGRKNDNWKLNETETEKKAVKQSGYPWNQSEDVSDVYGG